jgi:adenylate cyclase
MKQEVSLGGKKEIPIEDMKNYFVKKGHRQNQFEVKIETTYEVDEFYGANKKQLLLKLSLSLSETFTKPNWLGIEVTNDNRYYNSNLSNNPFELVTIILKPQSLPSSLQCLYFLQFP